MDEENRPLNLPDINEESVKMLEGQSATIPVINEQLVVEKEIVETGRVRITKSVNKNEELVNIPVNHEEVNVERVAVNQIIESPPEAIRYEGDTMIIPVLKEVLVIEKKLLLIEELHITKRSVQTNEEQKVTLRQEEINIERS